MIVPFSLGPKKPLLAALLTNSHPTLPCSPFVLSVVNYWMYLWLFGNPLTPPMSWLGYNASRWNPSVGSTVFSAWFLIMEGQTRSQVVCSQCVTEGRWPDGIFLSVTLTWMFVEWRWVLGGSSYCRTICFESYHHQTNFFIYFLFIT